MPRMIPISWKNLVARLKKNGLHGPYQEGKHPYMMRGEDSIVIPNAHGKDIGVSLLLQILRQAGISRDEWMNDNPPRK